MPHPVHGGYHWVCVLNPDRIWTAVKGLLDDAHAYAVRRHENRMRRRCADDGLTTGADL
ncbi:DUF6194 family protein [Pseudonocardia sp. SCN 73-27]|uniref:DUF6194 family protein n=1 Tax=unclassified Pseudonocardia TaxID=2619320 RepID=UPI0025E70B64|nr:DUF6194 family protein [Pseudonocardia sp. SCN 73-27]